MKLLRVDLSSQTVRLETRSEELSGGRHLTTKIVAAEVDPGCDPLSPDNILVWATGPLAGWRISCGDRLSLGGKSPLTGGIKEANSGGEVAGALAGLDIRALIVEGAFPAHEPGLIVVDGPEAVRFMPAGDYWGLRLEETTPICRALILSQGPSIQISPEIRSSLLIPMAPRSGDYISTLILTQRLLLETILSHPLMERYFLGAMTHLMPFLPLTRTER